jgi:hypothetical protein
MIDCPTHSDAAKLSDEQLLEKLHGFGLEVDRAELERLCEGALSAEEVARRLLDRCGGRHVRKSERHSAGFCSITTRDPRTEPVRRER